MGEPDECAARFFHVMERLMIEIYTRFNVQPLRFSSLLEAVNGGNEMNRASKKRIDTAVTSLSIIKLHVLPAKSSFPGLIVVPLGLGC